MPMCRILPFAFFEQRRRDHVQRIVVFGKLDAMQIEHVDMVGAHQAERIVEARHHLLRRPPFLAAKLGLGRDHHGSRGMVFSARPTTPSVP